MDEALEDLRAELHAIDGEFLDVLRRRLECCVRIGEHKRVHGVPMMQPGRIAIVQDRAAKYAATHGIDSAFLRRLYEMVIAETCRLEDAVIEGKRPLR
jgi:4-amino-4-deoxychorismate mutase